VSITAGWDDAYYVEFSAGGGPRSLVTSYASSPPADVLFADPPVDAPRTGVLADSCFRQIEFAGILAGSEHPEAAAALIDFMLSLTYQEDIPLNMFVYPANQQAALPDVFTAFGQLTDDPVTMDPETIEANRDDWTARWTDIVFG
jgi:thiamine transport system substrate-binding protein